MFPQISVSSWARHIKHSKVETSKINLQTKINSMSGKDNREKKCKMHFIWVLMY